MEQIELNVKEIMAKLAMLQSDINYIKEKLSLDEEMKIWEQISA